MAFLKSRSSQNHNVSLDIEFDGVLPNHVCSRLIVELIKYILYERQQIPAPYEQFKSSDSDVKIENDDEDKFPDIDNTDEQMIDTSSVKSIKNKIIRKRPNPPSRSEKSKTKTIQDLDELFNHIELCFKLCPSIGHLVFILGGTIVNPKECYIIRVPRACNYDGPQLASKVCVRTLFKKLFTSDIFSLPITSPTSINFLIEAPRESELPWFLPKQTFKLPTKGQLFELNIISTSNIIEPKLNSTAVSHFELSGITPLDKSVDGSFTKDMSQLCINDDSTMEEEDLNETSCIDVEDDFIWFQAPLKLKGFKEKVKDGAFSIWA